MFNPELPGDTRGSAHHEHTCGFCRKPIEGDPIRKNPFGVRPQTPAGLFVLAPTMALVWEFCSEECYQQMWLVWLDQ